MKLRALLIIPVLFLMSLSAARGEDWKFYSANEHFVCLYDQASISRPAPQVIRVWTEWFPSEKGRRQRNQELDRRNMPVGFYENYGSSRVLMEIHCTEKTYLIITAADYDQRGRELSPGPKPCFLKETHPMSPIRPNSSEADLYQALCRGKIQTAKSGEEGFRKTP